ncbi:MAG: hypothetical protein M3Q37_01025 [Gemmatimonadota bacterium]|nr:hypothetical protein [Gemmatimonadota bacterium]
MTRPHPPPSPVLDQALVQVFLGALLAETDAVVISLTVPPPERLHLGRPWPETTMRSLERTIQNGS